MGVGGSVALSMIHVSFQLPTFFVHSSTAADQGYHAFGELARFFYCFLQKFKKTSSLPLAEQGKEYVVPNLSRFPAIDEKDFLSDTRVMAALEKVGSQCLRTEFRRDARRFLEESVNCVLSTVASRSVVGQGLSCFCPVIVVGGDEVAPLQLFNKLLDWLLETGWTRGSDVEAWRYEYQSFVQEQRQLKWSSTRSRPDVGDVLSFCSAQAGFRARQHLYKVCIIFSQICSSHHHELSRHPQNLVPFHLFQLRILVIRGPASRGEKFSVSLDCVAIKQEDVRGVLLCVQDFVRSPHSTLRNSFSESGFTMLSESVAITDSNKSSPVYAPWSIVQSACASQVITHLCVCWEWVVLRSRTARDTSECWYYSDTPRIETASRPGLRISDVVEEGRVENVPVASSALGLLGPSKIRLSPCKRKRKTSR